MGTTLVIDPELSQCWDSVGEVDPALTALCQHSVLWESFKDVASRSPWNNTTHHWARRCSDVEPTPQRRLSTGITTRPNPIWITFVRLLVQKGYGPPCLLTMLTMNYFSQADMLSCFILTLNHIRSLFHQPRSAPPLLRRSLTAQSLRLVRDHGRTSSLRMRIE